MFLISASTLELFTQSKLGETDSIGEAKQYERESEIVIFAGDLFVPLTILFWLLTVNAWFE